MRKLMGISLFLATTSAMAAGVPVEERGPDFSSYPQQAATQQRTTPQAAPNQALVDLHYELQELREEVRSLRGVVEEQANDLRELRQRQMDDYQDLDRRIGSGGVPVVRQTPPAAIPALPPAPEAAAPGDDSGFAEPSYSPAVAAVSEPDDSAVTDQGEYEAYTATYNLLKARKIDEAVVGFKNLVAKYPAGKYTANSYYWLGEIYLLQNNLPEAEKAFGTVSVNFPAHRKAPDAMFKLAKVYHLQGQGDKAKQLLNKVASGTSTAAPLARAYLSENF